MNKSIDIPNLYRRMKDLLIRPHKIWPIVYGEKNSVRNLFRTYLIPVAALSSVAVLLSILQYTVLQTLCYTIINFVSVIAGTYVAFLFSREYLNGKLRQPENTALTLTVYSASVFIVFHSVSVAFVSGFFSQLATLISLVFLKTLYTGIHTIPALQPSQKTNILIISGLSIICIPIILKKFLMILFHIPAFNL